MAKDPASEREKRLAEALRQNLTRRKQQARAKTEPKSDTTDEPGTLDQG
jgi:hypothetical protein